MSSINITRKPSECLTTDCWVDVTLGDEQVKMKKDILTTGPASQSYMYIVTVTSNASLIADL